MENKLDIVILSDTHGYLPPIDKPFDLLLMCGDISPAHDHYYAYQINWFQHEFADWVNSLPYKDENSKVVFIGGNHDCALERIDKSALDCFYISTNNRAVYLKNTTYDFAYDLNGEPKTLSIFGTPYCKIFGNWFFMVSDEKLKQKYSACPDDIDIVISHDAADINNLGLIKEGHYANINAGNVVLADMILEKKPKYYFCGHIHSGNHSLEKVNDTYMANVSYVNEAYYPMHDILYISIDKETKNLI